MNRILTFWENDWSSRHVIVTLLTTSNSCEIVLNKKPSCDGIESVASANRIVWMLINVPTIFDRLVKKEVYTEHLMLSVPCPPSLSAFRYPILIHYSILASKICQVRHYLVFVSSLTAIISLKKGMKIACLSVFVNPRHYWQPSLTEKVKQ
jgi:hypothetical protein